MRRRRARLAAEGYLFVHGVPILRARRQRAPGDVPPHGTEARYRWSGGYCSCVACRAAHAAVVRRGRARRRDAAKETG